MSLFTLNLKNFLIKNNLALAIIGLIITVNLAVWILNFKTSFSAADIYTLLLLGLVLIFSEKKPALLVTKPLVFFLILNAIFCTLETQLGLMSVFVDTFRQPYVTLSQFLTSNKSLLSNTDSIIRKINDYLIIIRPSGLFSNLHLSSFALFCFYSYLNLRKEHKFIQMILIFLILIGGTLQTLLCLIAYLFLCSFKSIKKLAGILLFIATPFMLYVFTIYGPQKTIEYNNMFRIFSDSIYVLKSLPLKTILWGDSIYNIISEVGQSINHSDMLIESGILRYTVTFGLVNISLIVMFFIKIYLNDKSEDKRPYYFLIATLGTYFHYFMPVTLIGGILVIFVFRSNQFITINQKNCMNDVEEKYEKQGAISGFKRIVNINST